MNIIRNLNIKTIIFLIIITLLIAFGGGALSTWSKSGDINQENPTVYGIQGSWEFSLSYKTTEYLRRYQIQLEG